MSTFAVAFDEQEARKRSGAFYTPPDAVRSLVAWAVHSQTDLLLDPSCGDGRFLAAHRRSVGVEQDPSAYALARQRAPWAVIHEGDFFSWAATTTDRFDCAAGNPPFIRYQRFAGPTRERALGLCRSLGATFSALTSSWAPFLVATASLLKPGGRLAFVVPSEIGHAPYAEPLARFLIDRFGKVAVVAVREKIFAELSEDVWLLYAEGFGDQARGIDVTIAERLKYRSTPPPPTLHVTRQEWKEWGNRLRPFLAPGPVRDLYKSVLNGRAAVRLGSLAKVGIGYVTGANEFFHLRPSAAEQHRIPRALLTPAVRNGRMLTGPTLTRRAVRQWIEDDEPVLLLRLTPKSPVPAPVQRYLDSPAGIEARRTYKCRNRSPWYVVPDVTVPDAFLAYMSSYGPTLVANGARCVGTNSVHAVHLTGSWSLTRLQRAWQQPFTQLSCELEGHPLGGGVLKIEPREAARVGLLIKETWSPMERRLIAEGTSVLRRWRHCRGEATQGV